MTETPHQEHPAPDAGPTAAGVNTENLRDYKQLRRSVTDRKVAGVAGGLGKHLNIDPTLIRVAFVVLAFFGGAGVLLYVIAWLLVPEEGQSGSAAVRTSDSTRNTVLIVGAAVAALIVIAHSWGGFGFPWPLAILGLIAIVVLLNRDRHMNEHGSTPPPPPDHTDPTADPTTGPAENAPSGVSTMTAPVGASGAGGTATYPAGDEPPAPPWMPPTQQAYQPPQPRPDRGPRLFGLTLALVAVALGSIGLYDVAGGHVTAGVYPAVALAVVGAMLVLGAWVGRAGGLILLGILSVVALAATSVANPRWTDTRTVAYHPASTTSVHDHYFLSAGKQTLDLRNVRNVQALDNRTITVRGRVGEIVVDLPPGVSAAVTADVRVGDVTMAGSDVGGPQVHVTRQIGPVTNPEVNLDLGLFVGHIQVRQS
ncbi:MAG: PspC domain-containing protein [Nocardioidaceae bacterium]